MTQMYQLSLTEIKQFHRNGYIGPFRLCSPEEMAEIDREFQVQVFQSEGPRVGAAYQSRHMDVKGVYNLISRPEIVDRMASLYGPDLILWATYFFSKEPGGPEVPWHQDANNWPIFPAVTVSAWIAIDRTTRENSCVQIIPGSHRRLVPHLPPPDGIKFGPMADPAFVKESDLLNMEMDSGEFFLFSEGLLHRSLRNDSSVRRRGLAARVTVPFVSIEQDGPPLHDGHCAILLRGEDRLGFNRLCSPPT